MASKTLYSFLNVSFPPRHIQLSSQNGTYIKTSDNEKTTNLELFEPFSHSLVANSIRHAAEI